MSWKARAVPALAAAIVVAALPGAAEAQGGIGDFIRRLSGPSTLGVTADVGFCLDKLLRENGDCSESKEALEALRASLARGGPDTRTPGELSFYLRTSAGWSRGTEESSETDFNRLFLELGLDAVVETGRSLKPVVGIGYGYHNFFGGDLGSSFDRHSITLRGGARYYFPRWQFLYLEGSVRGYYFPTRIENEDFIGIPTTTGSELALGFNFGVGFRVF
jgi:hypothetical protein